MRMTEITWDALTEAQQKNMGNLMGWGGDALLIDEVGWRELEALELVVIRDLFVKVTPLGREVYDAGNPNAAGQAEAAPQPHSPQGLNAWFTSEKPADTIATLRAQLAAAEAERDAYRAALQEIASRKPQAEPSENPDYAFDDLEGREANIAASHFSEGNDRAYWRCAEIARKALNQQGGE